MRDVLVLGAGMAGVGAALHLQSLGWTVALVDRSAPGSETSYGNAGIIQGEAVEPYAMPRDVATLLAIALGRSNDVHYDLRALPHHVGPLLRYWWHSSPRRYRHASKVYAGLIAHATAEHDTLIGEAGAADLVDRGGFRILYRTARAMDAAIAAADRARVRYGVRSQPLPAAALSALEPALKVAGEGAIHQLDAWSVRDPGRLVAAYADLFKRRGGSLVQGEAETLTQTGTGWALRSADGPVEASAAVVALGPWSPELLRRFGYAFPMVRKRGYHRHWRAGGGLNLPLMDAANGYVMAPMLKGTRITTGAEFSAPDAEGTPVQLLRAEAAAREILDLGAPRENTPWIGTRPCMPDMLPVVGEAPRHRGLWLHFGHGHQGFTLGPTTGRLLAEMMSGAPPFVAPHPLRPGRY